MATVELIFLWLQLTGTFRSRLLKPLRVSRFLQAFRPGPAFLYMVILFSSHSVSCLRRTHYRPGILFPHQPGAAEARPALGQRHAHANAVRAPPGAAQHHHTRYTNDTYRTGVLLRAWRQLKPRRTFPSKPQGQSLSPLLSITWLTVNHSTH